MFARFARFVGYLLRMQCSASQQETVRSIFISIKLHLYFNSKSHLNLPVAQAHFNQRSPILRPPNNQDGCVCFNCQRYKVKILTVTSLNAKEQRELNARMEKRQMREF